MVVVFLQGGWNLLALFVQPTINSNTFSDGSKSDIIIQSLLLELQEHKTCTGTEGQMGEGHHNEGRSAAGTTQSTHGYRDKQRDHLNSLSSDAVFLHSALPESSLQ